MQISKLIYESASRAGREYQHLEDLTYTEGGTPGIRRALDILQRISTDTSSLTMKFDGVPNIYWGRYENGLFGLVSKNGWGKMKPKSATEAYDWFVSRGNQESWRHDYATTLVDAWEVLEPNTPKNFRGFVYGDLLFYPKNPQRVMNNVVTFGPGKVQYSVSANSPLGQRAQSAQIGIAGHLIHKSFGSDQSKLLSDAGPFNTSEVLVIGQVPVTVKVSVNTARFDKLEEIIDDYAVDINGFLMRRTGLTDIAQIIYRYVNHMSKTNQLHKLSDNFVEWLSESTISFSKQGKIRDLIKMYPTALQAIFMSFDIVLEIKNSIISQLDQAPQAIQANVNGLPGGEGYIDQLTKAKLVPRHRWKPIWSD